MERNPTSPYFVRINFKKNTINGSQYPQLLGLRLDRTVGPEVCEALALQNTWASQVHNSKIEGKECRPIWFTPAQLYSVCVAKQKHLISNNGRVQANYSVWKLVGRVCRAERRQILLVHMPQALNATDGSYVGSKRQTLICIWNLGMILSELARGTSCRPNVKNHTQHYISV